MDQIREFYGLADSYCRFISAKPISAGDIPELMELLMKLYLSAGALPDTEAETTGSSGTERIRISFEKQVPALYWEIFDPFVREDPVCMDLADDLSDIATDLRSGMREYEAGRTGNAVFEWKFGFKNHWGSHTVDALRALHSVRFR